ncbi:succinate-semialdehyde dehydrogenase [Actinobaculum suis]|uniref:aldehyde dehydrogenase family protein n=1 Tax=Actinobaculum suis TaxID=1657 RepID=UPI00066FEBAC|nr:aldehyde dehydrogenase family protein [Actinobaculum suis]KMY23952.1 succinate-semialdehyde dehydrogenase [Actinobaculum suis]
MSRYAVNNPNTGITEEEFPTLRKEEIPQVIDTAWQAYEEWRRTPIAERRRLMFRFGELCEENATELARIAGQEMGKPLADGKTEVANVAAHARWFGENAKSLLAPTQLAVSDGVQTYVRHDPLGVLLGIMPWNFPYSQIARFALPQIMVGNTILMKQAGICPRSSARFAELLREAGFPAGVYQNIYLDTADTETVLADFRVKGVSLTGSEAAGSAVASLAGKHLKRSLMELGGNDPMVVLDAADVAAVAEKAVRLRTFNAGQVCTSNKRIIVLANIYDEFLAAAKEAIAKIRVGAFDEDIDMGPLSSIGARDEVVQRVAQAVAEGATLHYGGVALDRPGAYMLPALLTDVPEEQDISCNELFGPVVVIYRARDEEDALRLANATKYGLQSSVWSEDIDRAERFAAQINAGMTIINNHRESGPEWPFGGINNSGYGREEAVWGLHAFTNEHAIRVHKTAQVN